MNLERQTNSEKKKIQNLEGRKTAQHGTAENEMDSTDSGNSSGPRNRFR